MLRYTTDRARPGLVALYDIWSGNGAGQFLQPRNPHGATNSRNEENKNKHQGAWRGHLEHLKSEDSWHCRPWALNIRCL